MGDFRILCLFHPKIPVVPLVTLAEMGSMPVEGMAALAVVLFADECEVRNARAVTEVWAQRRNDGELGRLTLS